MFTPCPNSALLIACLPCFLELLTRLGKGDKNAADQAAVDMMRKVLSNISMVSHLLLSDECLHRTRAFVLQALVAL